MRISNYPSYFGTFLNEKILPSLTVQQKKICAIAFAIFACVSCYLLYRLYKSRHEDIKLSLGYIDRKNNSIVLAEDTDLNENYRKTIEEALSYFPKGSFATYHAYRYHYIIKDENGKIEDISMHIGLVWELHNHPNEVKSIYSDSIELIDKLQHIEKSYKKIDVVEKPGLSYSILK